jgi:hypothetical protein
MNIIVGDKSMKRIEILLVILICYLSLWAGAEAKPYTAEMSIPSLSLGLDLSSFISGQIALSYLHNNYYFGARYYQYHETDLLFETGPEEKIEEIALVAGKAISSNTKNLLFIAFSTGISYNITDLQIRSGNYQEPYKLQHKEVFGLPLDIFLSYPISKYCALGLNFSYNFNSARDSYKGMLMLQLGDFTNYNYQP